MKKWTLSNVWTKYRLDALDYIQVCANCNQASCWLGEFYCDSAKTADVVGRSVRDLLKLGPLEHPEYWLKARIKRTRIDDGPLTGVTK